MMLSKVKGQALVSDGGGCTCNLPGGNHMRGGEVVEGGHYLWKWALPLEVGGGGAQGDSHAAVTSLLPPPIIIIISPVHIIRQ